jgi:hypothetical protein
MKESNFYSEDFEQLIREKTEQYKMYPSERVWRGVHNSLHTKRRWFIGSMSLLVTGILFLAGRELIAPSGRAIASRKPATTAGSVADATRPSIAENSPHAAPTGFRIANTTATTVRHNTTADSETPEDQDPTYRGISITLSDPVINPSDFSEWLRRIVRLPEHAPDLTVLAARGSVADGGRTPDDGTKAGGRSGAETASTRESAEESRETADADADGLSARSVLESLSARGTEQTRNSSRLGSRVIRNKTNGNAVTADGLLPDSVASSAKASATTIAEAEDRQRVNWLHDYAMNILPPLNKRGRTYFQLTLAPSANYRSLSGTDPALEKIVPTGGNGSFSNVHPGDKTDHSAAFGFEFGGSILYRVTRNLTFKGGLQFNFARYKITAFVANTQQGPVLNSWYGYVMDSLDRVGGTQQASSAGGNSVVTTQTLNNDLYQLSAPIGFELRVLGNERLQFNLGATVQPSYLLGATSYMLSADAQSYSKEPNKYRSWNVSGGVEAFLSYRVGNIRWQIGPEFRYQLLSTYTSANPINENLKGYGLKIGITKMLP